jgi:hypothetical protein
MVFNTTFNNIIIHQYGAVMVVIVKELDLQLPICNEYL